MTRPDPSLKQQSGVRTFLRVGGPLLLVIGGLMTIAAFASFFSSFGSFSGPPENFWMRLRWPAADRHRRGDDPGRIRRAQPAGDISGELTPTIRDTLGALGVGRPTLLCAVCGEENDADSRFCDGCGKPLNRACPSCDVQNDADARFCNACGGPLPA